MGHLRACPLCGNGNLTASVCPQGRPLPAPAQVFIVDFFSDSDAGPEWRVLCSYLAELAEAGGAVEKDRDGSGHCYNVQPVAPADAGAVRPMAFDERQHVQLAEELKHLYTALTRAKNNVVIFDRNQAKRAPFYHLLQSLGLARAVHK